MGKFHLKIDILCFKKYILDKFKTIKNKIITKIKLKLIK